MYWLRMINQIRIMRGNDQINRDLDISVTFAVVTARARGASGRAERMIYRDLDISVTFVFWRFIIRELKR